MQELEFHLEPGLVVSISEPPALPEHLLQQLRRSGGGNGVLKQRRSDTTFEAVFFWGKVARRKSFLWKGIESMSVC